MGAALTSCRTVLVREISCFSFWKWLKISAGGRRINKPQLQKKTAKRSCLCKDMTKFLLFYKTFVTVFSAKAVEVELSGSLCMR